MQEKFELVRALNTNGYAALNGMQNLMGLWPPARLSVENRSPTCCNSIVPVAHYYANLHGVSHTIMVR